MKNRKRKWIALLLAAVTCFTACMATACGSNEDTTAFLLKYDTGIDENHNFDNETFMYNDYNTLGADPGCIYISEEDDSEYGGYFYAYVTGSSTSSAAWATSYDADVTQLAFKCFRSKDLSTWELCGAADGYSMIVKENDWEDFSNNEGWAPEVIYNAEDEEYPYYMYYTVPSKIRESGKLASTKDGTYSWRQHIGIARAKTPVGPFYSYSDTETVDGVTQSVPYIDFREAYDLSYDVGVIDVHPFVDDDGTLYLYFKGELAEQGTIPKGIYGMKMNSYTEPDYTTVTFLAQGGYTTVNCTETGKAAFLAESINYEGCESYDGGTDLIEAPYVWKHNENYYLTFSFHGYDNQSYSVLQAIGDSPLGSFTTLQPSEGNPILDGGNLQYVKGTGHHSFVEVDGDLFIVYHRHANTTSMSSGWGRYFAADKVTFTEVNGVEIMTTNGPSLSLQWAGEALTGYRNLAEEATVSVSTGEGAQYLTDSVIPMYDYVSNMFFTADGDVEITFTFDSPVSVEKLMIHNSGSADDAFSKISEIRFELAEQPSFVDDTYTYAVIQDLEFPSIYASEDDANYLINCAPAVACFDEITVSSIKITIEAEDRLNAYNKYGEAITGLSLAEIVILGR